MPEKEDKQKILDYLCEALQHTRSGSNIDNIKYVEKFGSEYAVIEYDDYSANEWCDITADSGSAMLADVIYFIRKVW